MSHEQPGAGYAGVDWATEKHDVCLLDETGHVLGERAFGADAEGLVEMADWLTERSGLPPDRVGVAIEVPHGPVVETLMERGFAVHSLNPKQLDRFRDRFTVAGAKDDRRDARVLADSLRTDGRAFRSLEPDDPVVIELREWSRMTADLKREDNMLCNRARQQLRRYFPAVLALDDDVGRGWILDLLELVPTPADAGKRRNSSVEKILRRHRIRRWKAPEVLATLRRPALTVAPGTVQAATAHLRQVAARIRLVRSQLAECEARLDELSVRVGLEGPGCGEGQESEYSDAEILRSVPGVGRIVVATLLAEASRPVRDRDYTALRTLSGIAPVTRRSGKSRLVRMRSACNPRLRNAMYHAARVASQSDEHWRARYQALRARGRSHGRACRGVADALMRVAVAMLREGTLYDRDRIGARRVA